ncbi:hypothetical protein GF336_01915 [Candidatus Woesearchaeota archaeon]|nr:hypothetical protein [Candidatus Woesearchaeota archaeon]
MKGLNKKAELASLLIIATAATIIIGGILSNIDFNITGLAIFQDNDINDFNGSYDKTFYNSSFIQLNISQGYSSGNYTSYIFDAQTNVTWNNISWTQCTCEELPKVSEGESDSRINTSGMVLYYNLNQNTGSIEDFSGNDNDGTNNGATYFNTGKCFGAYEFNGVDEYINSNYDPVMTSKDFSFSAWFKHKVSPTGRDTIMGAIADSPDFDELVIIELNDGDECTNNHLSFQLRDTDNPDPDIVCGTSAYNDNTWHHVVATINQSTSTLYLYEDGVLTNSEPITGNSDGTIDFTGYPIWIGALNLRNGFYGGFNGSIDEVAIFNRSLSPSEVYNLYERGAVKLNLTVRNCTQSDCSDGTWQDIQDESPQNLNLNSRYFQYNAEFQTNNLSFTPKLYNVTIDYTDITPPIITNVNATPTNQSANITWDTDENANSSVNYGLSTSLGTIESLDDSTTSHKIQLTPLTNNTLYYYNVTSCDASNNCKTEGPFNFTTLSNADEPPKWISIPNNQTIEYANSLNVDFDADDDIAISQYFIDDDVNFTINPSNGTLKNNTLLQLGTYLINVSVNDTSNNINSTIFKVTVQDSTAPTISMITPVQDDILGWTVILRASITDNNLKSVIYEIWNNTDPNQVIEIDAMFPIGGGIFNATFYTNDTWPYNTSLAYTANMTLAVYANDTFDNQTISLINWTLDNSKPSIQFIIPSQDGSFINSNFNLDIFLANHLLNYSNYTITNTTIVQSNETGLGQSEFTWEDAVDVNSLAEGNYTVTVYAEDSTEVYNGSELIEQHNNRTKSTWFYIDKTDPQQAAWVDPTPQNNTYTDTQTQTFNFTCNETFIDEVWIDFNGTEDFTETGSSGTSYWWTFSGLEGQYTYTGHCNDTAGNSAETETRTLNMDIIPPKYSNVQDDSGGNVIEGTIVNISALWQDNNILDTAIFRTNESGSWTTISTCSLSTSQAYCNKTLNTIGDAGETICWNQYANDTAGNINNTMPETSCFNVAAAGDSEPPKWSNNQSDIPQIYSPTTPSIFNITWQDNINVTLVYLESNHSGIQNYSMNLISGTAQNGTYNYSAIIPAGTFYWRSYARDASNWNSSDTFTFSIQKASPQCFLSITPSSTQYPNQINASCICTNPEAAEKLYRNGSDVTSENNQFTTLAAGSYNYTCNTTATQNYTSAENSTTLNIAKTSLTGLIANSTPLTVTYPTETNFSYSEANIGDEDVIYKLYRGNADVTPSDTQTLPPGTYIYKLNTTSGPFQNYTANSSIDSKTLTILQNNSNTCTLTSSIGFNYAYGNSTTLTCSCIGDGTAHLYFNQVQKDSYNNTPIVFPANTAGHSVVCNMTNGTNYGPASDSNTLKIAKANHTLQLAINNTESDRSYIYPASTNTTGYLEITQNTAAAELKRNSTTKDSGSPAAEIITLPAGSYNYTYIYPESQNYTAQSITRTLEINKSATVLSLISSPSWSEVNGTTTTINCSADNPSVNISLYRNDLFIGSSVGGTVSDTQTLAVGSYLYTCNTTENQNHTSASESNNLSITTKTTSQCSLIFDPISPAAYPNQVNASCSCTNTETTPNLYRNGSDVTLSENNKFTALAAGDYLYTCNTTATQNYTSASNSSPYTINKYPTTCTIDVSDSQTVYGTPTQVNCSCDSPVAKLYRNNIDVTSSENGTFTTLPAGYWYYVCNTSSSQNYTSDTDDDNINISKASTSTTLLINGSQADFTQNITFDANLTCTLNITGNVNMTQDGSQISYGASPLEKIQTYSTQGNYTINCTYQGSQNYTGSSDGSIIYALFYQDTTPPSITIDEPSGNYNQNDTVPFSIQTNENSTVTAIITYPNSTKVTITLNFNGTEWHYKENFSETLLPGTYNIVINATDNAGNSNTTSGSFNILDISIPLVTDVQPNNKNFSQNSTISINATVIDPYYDSITEVKANITWNTSFQTITLTKNNDLYTGTFSNTEEVNYYNITIIAKDSSNNINDTEKAAFYVFEDIDQDNKEDDDDYLIFNEDDVSQSGINLDIKVNNNTNIDGSSWLGTNTLEFYNNQNMIMNFTHNFSNTSKIYLSKVSIEIIDTGDNQGIAVNLSSQLLPGETKTLYIQDNDFISLCVKDSEITQVAQITNTCTGNNETDFTACLGNSTGYTNGSITCTDLGNWIKVENLTYSGIKGIKAPAAATPTTGGGGDRDSSSKVYQCGDSIDNDGDGYIDYPEDPGCFGIYDDDENHDCVERWQCESWNECNQNNIQSRDCTDLNDCGTAIKKPKEKRSCEYIPEKEELPPKEEAPAKIIPECILFNLNYGKWYSLCWYWWVLLIIVLVILIILDIEKKPILKKIKKYKARPAKKKPKKGLKKETKKKTVKKKTIKSKKKTDDKKIKKEIEDMRTRRKEFSKKLDKYIKKKKS